MQTWVYYLTALFLIGGWLFAVLFVRRRSARGTVIHAVGDAGGPANWLQSHWLVETDDGRRVTARAHGCVQCQGGLRPGRRVGVLSEADGFVVTLTESCRRIPAAGKGG
jgi:hypothetical protein